MTTTITTTKLYNRRSFPRLADEADAMILPRCSTVFLQPKKKFEIGFPYHSSFLVMRV